MLCLEVNEVWAMCFFFSLFSFCSVSLLPKNRSDLDLVAIVMEEIGFHLCICAAKRVVSEKEQ